MTAVTIYSLFEQQVKNTPDSIAVSFNGNKVTYKKLAEESDKIAYLLSESRVKQGDIVGLCLNRSAEMIMALLGIIKSGAAYLPLDPFFPDKRLEYMLNDSSAGFLITESLLFPKFSYYKGKFIDVSEIKQIRLKSEIADKSDENNLAYVIYTSGSTGNPKGVQIAHNSLTNFLLSMQNTPGINEKDNILALTTLSFDISGLEIFLPLITGSKITMATREEAKDGKSLLDKIKKEKVTVVQATPSTWKMMIDSGWKEKLKLKALCGGEPLPKDLADKLLERVDELWNMYGPTETTIWSSCSKVVKGEPIHLGKPIANTQFYIVDKDLNFCAPGVAGELLIGGAGLSTGYLNKEELTKEKFIKNPFDKEGKSRVYRTGDLVKLNSRMQLEFLGRIDNQVKIRGYRIELEEIENVIKKNEAVKDCAVIVKEINNDKKIIAYLVLKSKLSEENLPSEINSIRDVAIRNLPDYMIPALIIPIEQFPLTPNNKVDKKTLAEKDISGIISYTSSAKAETENQKTLVQIWENLLGITGIGIDDNFFELGGHSILAAQMLANFEKATGKKIPLAEMFTSQTIRQLSAIIEAEKSKMKWSPLVEIRKGDVALPPLFLIHGAEGNIFLYRDLAKRLNSNRTVYGIQARGLNGEDHIHQSIEEMAADYIKAIKSVQSKGPYHIGGYCMGGSVAYEMALQLSKNGDEVANVFLLETYNACLLESEELKKNRIKEKIENIKFHFVNVNSLSGKEKIAFIQSKAETALKRTSARISKLSSSLGLADNNESKKHITLTLREINDNAQMRYSPGNYKGKVVLLKPKVSFATESDPKFGWGDFVEGGLKIYNLDVAPRGMLSEPFVKQTSGIIDSEMSF
ncbi:Nonribosomal peptide synthetase DhbF [Ignavibacterium album JCM 16511]|uniref:Nonribosomal peptide synthetase DhbF n=1 Tax=Ignavibacterium album (strain DSM 19864 / JCM 16511 / NBRC 101810 / Mat9-16) TaxID=945713 RepID=I0AMI0_IGNAJ|nr:amino acid adenylation domain-containing protein [Ignavibacterium album]AFH50187.1 Nonribosomal peptide synthetase DhbF [Ignavibacterium album JCM 16511]